MMLKRLSQQKRIEELHEEDAKHEKEEQKEEDGGEERETPLSINHLQTLFTILALSWVMGGAVLALEIMLHHHCSLQR